METKRHAWKFCQVFGDRNLENVQKADIISAIEFDQTGDYMAAGDNGGRLVLFNIAKQSKSSSSKTKVEYNFITEFQSHEPDFDHLRSLEIEERINAIKFLPQTTSSHLLLTTNDKTIKLWKVTPTTPLTVVKTNTITDSMGRILPGTTPASLRLPSLSRGETTLLSTTRKIFGNAHTYHINSLSLCSDHELFLSSDDLRVNLWNLEYSDVCYNVVDIKPDNIDDITQLITCSSMPIAATSGVSSLFQYSTSKGITRICDMRRKALSDQPAIELIDPTVAAATAASSSDSIPMMGAPSDMPYFICDAKFSPDGRFVLTRDFYHLRLWDLKMARRPLLAIPLHDAIKSSLLSHLEQLSLMQDGSALDKFSVDFSSDSRFMLTGSYNNRFLVYDTTTGKQDAAIEASRILPAKKKTKAAAKGDSSLYASNIAEPLTADTVDFSRKLVKVAWHPQQNILALAACSNLYIYAE